MRNALAFAFVVLTQAACVAIYADPPLSNGIASDNWRDCMLHRENCS